MFMGLISYGLGDYRYPFETWAISFSLPLWSLMTIGLWYDTGRLLIGSTIDSFESSLPNWIRASSFIVWMSIILTYIVYIHIDVQAIQMLLVIPVLGFFLREWLICDWSYLEIPNRKQLLSLLVWSVTSYLTYWVLTFCWIILRVSLIDATENGIVLFIQQ